MSAAIIEDIVEQHFDEASFLWSQRDFAVTSPLYSLQTLAELDERVEAHIDGLRVAGNFGWELCEKGLDDEDPGTIFTAAMVAFESGVQERIELVVETCANSPPLFRAAVSALGWLSDEYFRSTIKALVSAKSWQLRSLGIAACGIRRINPRAYLNKAADSSNLFLKLSAFKAAGKLKRLDLLPLLQENFSHEVPSFRFEATRSALLMGDRTALDAFSEFALTESRYTLPALQIALRLVDGPKALEWLKEQSKKPEKRRQMLLCTGIVGDPAYVPMLIRQMTRPELARAAGSAFSMITGVDLANARLDGEMPQGFKEKPTDDPEDEDVQIDPDEDLFWPDAERVDKWWSENYETYPKGSRFLAGHPITYKNCMKLLRTGNQRDRHVAALELALSRPEEGYFNVKRCGLLQMRETADKTG